MVVGRICDFSIFDLRLNELSVEGCGLRVEKCGAVVAKYPPNEVSRAAVARGVRPRRRERMDTIPYSVRRRGRRRHIGSAHNRQSNRKSQIAKS